MYLLSGKCTVVENVTDWLNPGVEFKLFFNSLCSNSLYSSLDFYSLYSIYLCLSYVFNFSCSTVQALIECFFSII